ncbi:MAG: hypothetical protein Q9198_001372 [Flavoplaca austrocitrina]
MDGMLGTNPIRHFQYLGCSGALIDDIKNNQVPKMQRSKAVLLSAGGNDAHLAVILNYCVYQWASKFYLSCDPHLDSGESEVKSDGYINSLKSLLQAVEAKLANDASRIYWAGYMKFFDDTSADCDEVTWAFSYQYTTRQFLTQARRRRFNRITDLVNQKIQDACRSVKRCVYVDSEPSVDRLGGRMCEPGVNEKSTTKDNDEDEEKNIDQPEKRQLDDSSHPLDPRNDIPGPLNNDTFQGKIGNFILQGTQEQTMDVEGARAGEVNAAGIPTWMGRCFHLTKFGNEIVASNIILAMINEQAKMMNQPAEPIVLNFDACPIGNSLEEGKDSVEESPTTESPDPLECHGVGGDVWMLHSGQAVSAAEQFCAQDIKEKEYFQDSEDHVKLTLSHNDPAKPISDLTDCVEKFKTIIDSCDGDNPSHNPHNYKFGGTYTDASSGWEFKLEPLALKPTDNTCDVSYKFVENHFEVRVKNFPDAKLGADGEGLKGEIEGCGLLTSWKFEWTPDDPRFQWFAKGKLPIGTKSCVGAATQSAGGKHAGSCKGPG